jgi:hypothetical protein
MRISTITGPLKRSARSLAALLLAACSGITQSEASFQKYGAVNFVGKRASATQGRAAATVVFFESLSLQVPNSSAQQSDQCVFAPVDTVQQVARGDRQAGTTVGITIGGATRQLAYSSTDLRYATAANEPIIYNVGDVAQVNVPGDGNNFPAIAGSVKLAELTVNWNGTNDPTAAVILQVKYANPATASFANEQVFCALKDDGNVVVPAGLLTQFLASSAPRRSLTLVRWRTNLVETTAGNLHLTSSIDTTFVFP